MEVEIDGLATRLLALQQPVAREYRLFNHRWYPLGSRDCGIWIVRDGLSQEVQRNSRGTRLEPGDEIHLGRAVVLFEGGSS